MQTRHGHRAPSKNTGTADSLAEEVGISSAPEQTSWRKISGAWSELKEDQTFSQRLGKLGLSPL